MTNDFPGRFVNEALLYLDNHYNSGVLSEVGNPKNKWRLAIMVRFRSKLMIALLLLIVCLSVSVPSFATTRHARVVDLHGRPLSSLYQGLHPTPGFSEIINNKEGYSCKPDSKPRKVALQQARNSRASTHRAGRVLRTQSGSCYGCYMFPDVRECGCGDAYPFYQSTGDIPNSGYKIVYIYACPDNCPELPERQCTSFCL